MPFSARYHIETCKTSNSFELLLQMPIARARLGMNSAAENHTSKLVTSPAIKNLIAAPPPVTTVTRNPANQVAGSCLVRGEAEEKTICPTLWRISRLPNPDQIKTGHSQVIGRMKLRTFSRVLSSEAINNPPAATNHHQRCPLNRSFSSRIMSRGKANPFSGVVIEVS